MRAGYGNQGNGGRANQSFSPKRQPTGHTSWSQATQQSANNGYGNVSWTDTSKDHELRQARRGGLLKGLQGGN